MGHKVPPPALRIGINKYWSSRWLLGKKSQVFLEADYLIRKIIRESFPKSGISEIIIERKSQDHCKVIIKTARPGLLIGREGQLLKNLIQKIERKVNPLFLKKKLVPPKLEIDILEIKRPFMSAAYLAEVAANEIEKGITVRKVLKRLIERARQHKEILGVKVKAAGRLDGSTIKRRETLIWGRMPLSKLIADIDYAERPVLTKYGYVGLKVWLYRGDKKEYSEDVTA